MEKVEAESIRTFVYLYERNVLSRASTNSHYSGYLQENFSFLTSII